MASRSAGPPACSGDAGGYASLGQGRAGDALRRHGRVELAEELELAERRADRRVGRASRPTTADVSSGWVSATTISAGRSRPKLGNLSKLKNVNLSDNRLTGAIPSRDRQSLGPRLDGTLGEPVEWADTASDRQPHQPRVAVPRWQPADEDTAGDGQPFRT